MNRVLILGVGYKKGTNAEKNYFFEKNVFGDVIAVYRNSDSVLIGTYEYDLWGNPVSIKEAAGGRDTDGILQKNPFWYRCYYYDTETGFYYLNSRYYDPQTRRFISADDVLAEPGASVIGYNLYSYCQNSPVGAADYDGHCLAVAADLLIMAAIVVTVLYVTVVLFPPEKVKAQINECAASVTATIEAERMKADAFKSMVDAGIKALKEKGDQRRNDIYTVYALYDKDSGMVKYVGRTRNYEKRMEAHRISKDKGKLIPTKLGENLTYDESRGLEQAAMLYYHTLDTTIGLNKINGISPRNKNVGKYIAAAKGVIGYAENQISNELLDWMDK